MRSCDVKKELEVIHYVSKWKNKTAKKGFANVDDILV